MKNYLDPTINASINQLCAFDISSACKMYLKHILNVSNEAFDKLETDFRIDKTITENSRMIVNMALNTVKTKIVASIIEKYSAITDPKEQAVCTITAMSAAYQSCVVTCKTKGSNYLNECANALIESINNDSIDQVFVGLCRII